MSVVAWSGGCDSTAILYGLALKAREDGSQTTVRAVSIDLYNSSLNQRVKQREIRNELKREFRKRGLPIYYSEIKIKASGHGFRSTFCAQAVIWLPLLIQTLAEKEDLYLGYHKGDDAIEKQAHIHHAFDNLQYVRDCSGKLYMPLIKYRKRDVIEYIKKSGIYEKTWWCEGELGKKKPCGSCAPCVTHETALWQIKRWPKAGWELSL